MKPTPIDHVSDTAFWVAHYRAMESARPDALFRDPLAERLVGDRGRKISAAMAPTSRYTAWSIVSRTVIIDRFISNAIRDGIDAVINLGAGLDTRPYRMNLPRELPWIEVDYPSMIAHKNEALKDEAPQCRMTRVALDLADKAARRKFLASAVPNAQCVLVITEGVVPYLTETQVSELARDLRAHPRFRYWITEYFHPKVYPYLLQKERTQAMRNAPFQFFPDDWFPFFKKFGWAERETRYTGEIAIEFGRKPPMPWWAALLFPILPRSDKALALRMSGYTVLGPSD